MGARSLTRGRVSSSEAGATAHRLQLVERLPGGQASNLLGVEDLARSSASAILNSLSLCSLRIRCARS